MKFIHKDNRLSWILCAVMLVIAVAVYPGLPDQIPTHFNAAGEVDGTGPRIAILMMPAVTAFLLLLGELAPRIDPRRNNYRRFQPQYYLIYFVCTLLFFFLELYTIAVCFRPDLVQTVNMGVWMPALVGAMIAVCGNIMPKFKHNYFAGIKTPWTLADEDVWYLTHRFTGKLFVLCGILMIFIGFLPTSWKVPAFIPLVLVMAVVPYLYSYLAYRKKISGQEPSDD